MLVHHTLSKLAARFEECNHTPSPEQWDALRELAETLQAMADGTVARRFFLSSLDPGVGKSQTLIAFVDALLASPAHQHVGVLLCVSRLSEVERMVRDISISSAMLAVRTSDAKLNALGTAEENAAHVVITTQQMMERRLAERTFSTAGLFPFQGKPRAVRIWDEAFLPGQPITLAADSIAFVLQRLAALSPDLRRDVGAIFKEVDALPSGATYVVPDFADKYQNVSLNDALALAEVRGSPREDERMALSSLWFISGKRVSIRRDGAYGGAIIDYRETLPEDLAPMVILDASGRVRSTYRDMEGGRGSLVRLRSAPKSYGPLTIHTWLTGGGKSAFVTNRDRLVAGIAKTIDSRPHEHWLVVCHRSDGRVGDIEKAISTLATAPRENVRYITWGNHSATNEFVDTPNVILAGTLFYRGSYYEALKRLSAGRPAAAGPVLDEEMRDIELGEHAHLILQALCRGAVRKCDGDKCHPAHAYVIASVRSGIPDALPRIFPGCQVERWSPLPRMLRGDAEQAFDYIESWASRAKPGDALPFKHVQRDLGIDRTTFNTTVRRGLPFVEALAELGVEEWGKGRYSTAFRLLGRLAELSIEAAPVVSAADPSVGAAGLRM
jgi:hypothetical protein